MSALALPLDDIHDGYGGPGQPLGAYAALMAMYGVAFGSFIALVKSGRIRLTHQPAAAEILLVGLAASKLTRIIALDEVTSAVRAPFVKYAGRGDVPSEVKEHPRGKGMQKAVGTLISCPYCLAPWMGAAGVIGLTFAPKLTRCIASIFAVAAISDWLNTAYDRAWKA